jgi:hypothetical protein
MGNEKIKKVKSLGETSTTNNQHPGIAIEILVVGWNG